jgi:hypothetical protein
MITNSNIAEYIRLNRIKNHYPIHDNDIVLDEPDKIYLLNEAFWENYKERYGCDVIIQLRKYESFEKCLPPGFQKGPCYSSFDVQVENYYEPELDSLMHLKDPVLRTEMALIVPKL